MTAVLRQDVEPAFQVPVRIYLRLEKGIYPAFHSVLKDKLWGFEDRLIDVAEHFLGLHISRFLECAYLLSGRSRLPVSARE